MFVFDIPYSIYFFKLNVFLLYICLQNTKNVALKESLQSTTYGIHPYTKYRTEFINVMASNSALLRKLSLSVKIHH